MWTCERCKIDDPSSRQRSNVSTHEVIVIDDPGLTEPVRLSLGFWKAKGNGEHALCAHCKMQILIEAAYRIMNE